MHGSFLYLRENFQSMHVYRFRITSDENDEFLREVDVLANQTFEDFHNCLVKTCKFSGNELASFYLCDNQWRKRREITLMDMNVEMYDEDESNSKSEPNLIMKDARLNKTINDPHQKMLYVYDYLNMYTVNIELVKIFQGDITLQFPIVTKEISDIIAPPTKLSKIDEEEEFIFNEDELNSSDNDLQEGDDDNFSEENFYSDDSSDI